MRQPSRSRHSPHALARRLDRAIGELNIFLLAVVIGLAVLDATCLVIRLATDDIGQTPITIQAAVGMTAAAPLVPPAGFGR